jgi:Zn-dependent peptidase ImmA (M78 family)
MSHKDTFIIIEKTKEYLSRYLELEESIGIRNNFINPLEDFTNITTYDQVVQAADMLRQKWSLGKGPIYNIVELLEDKNIKVLKLNVDEDFDGLQTFVNGDIPVIAFNILKANKPDRIRFTLLHELAHLLLKFGNIIDREKENFCHKFAGAMLMPKETIIAELGQFRNKLSINELGKIKLQYGISMQALVMRAKDCGIINEHYTKQFFFLMKQMNWRIDEPFEYAGLEQSNRFEQLIFRGLIEDQIPIEKAAELSDLSVQQFKKLHNIF